MPTAWEYAPDVLPHFTLRRNLVVGAVFSENLHAPAIVGVQVRRITFGARCVMRQCVARATISIRPIDYIGRPATADLSFAGLTPKH